MEHKAMSDICEGVKMWSMFAPEMRNTYNYVSKKWSNVDSREDILGDSKITILTLNPEYQPK